MTISVCIQGLIAEGQIRQGQAAEAERIYDQHFQALKRQMGMMAATSLASERTIATLRSQLLRRRLLAAQTITTRQRILTDFSSYLGKSGGAIDPRAGVALLGTDARAPFSSVEGRMRAVRGRAHGMIDQVLAKHSSDVTGRVRNRADLEDMTRELFGEDTGNLSAREFADAWTQSAEMLRQRFNAAGGDIGKIERWGLPQSHDSRQVRAAGYEAWRAEVLPRLDRAKMIDRTTGMPFEDDALDAALQDVFASIRSDGWSKRDPGSVAQGALASRRADSRFLTFKSGDDWMAYAEKFGTGNAFDAMMGHIDGMSRDIALLEILGPNPSSTLSWVKDTLTKSAETDLAPGSKGEERANAAGKQIDRIYAEITGSSQRPENRNLALAFSAVRSWQTAAKLGGATLSAVTDTAFQFAARRFNGLPAAGMLGDYAKLMRPGAIEDQKLAVRLGLIAEEWGGRTAAQGRYLGEELTGETARRLAEGVLRVSGLARFTQAGRWAFGMEMLGHITDMRGKSIDALEPAFRGLLERYGIGAAEWDKIRATRLEDDRGVDWIKPANIEDQVLGDRVLEMIARETDYAVPVPDIRTRAMINSVAPRGTWHGEIIKSAALFKSFGISVMAMQAQRVMAMAGPNRLRYVAGLTIGSTIMGALAIMLKDVAAGRDPRDATTPEFWTASLLQGGGWGIFGDFLKSSTSRAGGGLAGTMAGPLVGDVAKLASIPGSNNPSGDAFKFARDQLPGGTLWYARLAFDRQVADQLQEAVDPNYRKSWRRMNKWAEDQGTQFYWAPGDRAPDRAPDLSNITEGSPAQ